ncbi:hypothetical protein YC2023_120601 [Brassica napus]
MKILMIEKRRRSLAVDNLNAHNYHGFGFGANSVCRPGESRQDNKKAKGKMQVQTVYNRAKSRRSIWRVVDIVKQVRRKINLTNGSAQVLDQKTLSNY